MQKRKDEILAIIPEEYRTLTNDVVDELVFLENKLQHLKRLPFIEIHPTNPMKQRNTPAAKMYKEFLQQYINCVKVIETVIYRDKRLEGEEVEESPLRRWFNAHTAKKGLDA